MAAGLVHRGVSYPDPATLGTALLPALDRAARAGDTVTVALDQPTAAVVRDALADDVLAELEFVDPSRQLLRDAFQLAARRATAVAAAARDGRSSLVVAQYQPTLGLADAFWLRLEAALDEALRRLPATLLCAYRMGSGPVPADGEDAPSAYLVSHSELVGAGALEDPVPNDTRREPSEVVRGLPEGTVDAAPPGARRWTFGVHGLAGLRRELAAEVVSSGLEAEAVEDLVYAASEVATNAVEHGGGSGELWTWVAEGEAVCLIADPGRFREPFPGVVPPAPDQGRGRGLWLARALCDEVDVAVDEDGTRVRLARRFSRSEPATRHTR